MNVVYFSGGRPGFLLATLKGARAWAAVRAVYDQGGVLAGCSAGAMILGAKLIAPRLRLGWPWLAVRVPPVTGAHRHPIDRGTAPETIQPFAMGYRHAASSGLELHC